MSIKTIWSFYLTKHSVQRIFRYAETSIKPSVKSVFEKHIRNRLVRSRRVVSDDPENVKMVQRLQGEKMKKLIMFFIILAGCATVPVKAADTSLFNFGDFFGSMRAGYAINQHLEKSTVLYTPFKSFHNTAGLELLNINIGYDGLQKRPLVAAGLRMDNIDGIVWGGAWGKAHVTTAKLPSFEFGPYISGWPIKTDNGYKMSFFYGVAAAIGFQTGGK